MLALSLVAKAGPLEDAQDANSAALAAALSAYSDANDEYLPMSYWAGQIESAMGDITEEEFDNPELWAELVAAWAAIAAADATYYEGVGLMEEGDAYWEDYDAAQSDGERIDILNTITGYYWDAYACFDEAADAYFALEDELEDLCDDVEAQLAALAAQAMAEMTTAKGEMAGKKAAATSQFGTMNSKRDDAISERDSALLYVPNNQAAYDTVMGEGLSLFASAETHKGVGNGAWTAAVGKEAEGNQFEDNAGNATNSLQKYRAASSAKQKYLAAKTDFTTAETKYHDAWSDYWDAWQKFLSAQTK